jgi:hypothetical protein
LGELYLSDGRYTKVNGVVKFESVIVVNTSTMSQKEESDNSGKKE